MKYTITIVILWLFVLSSIWIGYEKIPLILDVQPSTAQVSQPDLPVFYESEVMPNDPIWTRPQQGASVSPQVQPLAGKASDVKEVDPKDMKEMVDTKEMIDLGDDAPIYAGFGSFGSGGGGCRPISKNPPTGSIPVDVPEPSSILLMLVGFVALAIRHK